MKPIPSSSMRAAALVAGVIVLGACRPGGHGPGNEAGVAVEHSPATVEVAEVVVESGPVFAELVGTVRPRLRADVAAKVTGRIVRMEATPGRRVESGDVVAEIEADEVRASVDRAEATLEQAERDLARYRELLEAAAVTQADFDGVEARARVARATAAEARTRLEDATIEAPFAGVITRKWLDAGDLAVPGKPLFSIEDPGHLQLEVDVAESLAGSLRLGDAVTVRLAAVEAEVEATVDEIAPSADVGSRTFLVKLRLPATEGVRAGQFGRTLLPRGTRERLVAPAGCVRERGQMDIVFVVEEGRARLRLVRTGGVAPGAGGRVEILSGLAAGERVVVDPPAGLVEGQPVVEGGTS